MCQHQYQFLGATLRRTDGFLTPKPVLHWQEQELVGLGNALQGCTEEHLCKLLIVNLLIVVLGIN